MSNVSRDATQEILDLRSQIDALTAQLAACEKERDDYKEAFAKRSSLTELQQQLTACEKERVRFQKYYQGTLADFNALKQQLQAHEETIAQQNCDYLKLMRLVDEKQATIDRLLDALGELYDVQNGPPLETTAVTWLLAMDKAQHALAEETNTDKEAP